MKKSYARIDFINCDTEYDYTICDWADVAQYAEQVRKEAENLDEKTFTSWNQMYLLPSVIISIVMMTEDEFSEWFKENIEKNA